MDSTNIKKSLYLALQLQEQGQDFVIVLNMMDLASKRGLLLDIEALEKRFHTRVFSISTTQKEGVETYLEFLSGFSSKERSLKVESDFQKKIKEPHYIQEKFIEAEKIMKEVTLSKIKPDSLTEKLDGVFLHPVWGLWIMTAILLLLFQLLFAWSDPFIGLIEEGFAWLGSIVEVNMGEGILRSLLVDGVIAGVGGFMVFLPHIMILFAFILFLEDFGYLARAAYLLDYLMRKLGLPGKAVVPLLSSHACAIPGIMSARIIENEKMRLLTMMISPLTTCSARLPVYALIIAAIIPDIKILGFIGLPGLVLFLLYFMGIGSAFLVAYIAKKFLFNTAPINILMELPGYKTPSLKSIALGVLGRAKIFVKKAGTVILTLSIVIWALVSFPKNEVGEVDIQQSYAAMVGKTIQPVFAPLGYDWKMTTALIPSFGAREVMVSALATVLSVEESEDDEQAFNASIQEKIISNFSLATLLSVLVWFVFAPQCISTFAVLKRETGSYKWPFIMVGYTLGLAYFFAFITFHVTNLLS
jgi:ferrous iron transport protein B